MITRGAPPELPRRDSVPAPGPALPGRPSRGRLAAWAASLAVLGWGMMTLGAFVRASESGLGCPDWPICHGQLIAGGHHALIEEIHRWVATVLVAGMVGLAVVVLRRHRHERRLTHPILWVLALLVLQVLLGGVTVLLRNVAWTVVLHYGAAALLVASIALVAVRLRWPDTERPPRDSFSRLVGWFVVLSAGLLLTGSTVANTDSHTACGRGFPLCNGSAALPGDHRALLNLSHRTWALAMLVLALWVWLRSRRDRATVPAIQRTAALVTILFLVQAGIGIAVVGVGENTAVDVLHSSVGSLTWLALATLLALTGTLSPEGQPNRGGP